MTTTASTTPSFHTRMARHRLIQEQASVAWVEGEPVAYDADDFRLYREEAVVMRHDGSIATMEVVYVRRDYGLDRQGYGMWESGACGSRQREGVTILGRVLARGSGV